MEYDIILITGDVYIDHPLNGIAIIKRFLEKHKFSVGVIETPNWKSNKDFIKLGKPKLCFGVTSGAMDSLVENYTPLKKPREEDEYNDFEKVKPDRAILVYCNKLKENFKDVPIVIGGIEASLRRFGHYDYWENRIRRSILFDSRADILAYGNAEYSMLEIAKRLKDEKDLKNIFGTCIISKTIPKDFILLNSIEEIMESKVLFCKTQLLFSNKKNLCQLDKDNYILQYKAHEYTSKELDEIYELPFTREVPRNIHYFRGMQFSVVTHRGCVGNCNFCSLSLHQGDKVVSRSEESILKEIKLLTKHKEFRGNIDDLGGPSANMYGMDCSTKCEKPCLKCDKLNRSHKKLISLLQKARQVPGVKKVFIRSGIRYDLALESKEYVKELVEYHISGTLKIAPEHCNSKILKLMNKYSQKRLESFIILFDKYNKNKDNALRFYFMTCHPGSSMIETKQLADCIKKLQNTESVQIFTPTPMTISTCMYYTGLDPFSLKKVYIPYTYNEKKKQKNIIFDNTLDIKIKRKTY